MSEAKSSKRRILIIDDEVSVTILYRRAIEQSGEFQVRMENDALRAVETARAFQPHLIFLDHHLPGKTGPELAMEMAGDLALKAIPIVFVTGDVDAAVLPRKYPLLVKPVRAVELVGACKAWALESAS